MIRDRLAASLIAIAAAGLASACGPQQVRTPEPNPKTATLVMLLPDPDNAAVGRVSVSGNAAATPASVELAGAREATIVGLNQPPTQVKTLSEAVV